LQSLSRIECRHRDSYPCTNPGPSTEECDPILEWEQPETQRGSFGDHGRLSIASQGTIIGGVDEDASRADMELVQQQLNHAIAAAVASAAISAVVETHAAAERTALLVHAQEQRAAHELKCLQREAQVHETAVAHTRMRIAAMQVVRHWKSWRNSLAWQKRSAAATMIQAHVKGFLVRNNLSQLQHKAACVRRVCNSVNLAWCLQPRMLAKNTLITMLASFLHMHGGIVRDCCLASVVIQ
jgi:hypothetical protein